MAQTSYEVTLSSNGRYSVTVKSDEPEAVEEALGWAREIHVQLARARRIADGEKSDEEDGEVPVCQVHNVPMVRQQGRHGTFWSCHQKNPDGSFCSYRPANRQA